MLVLTRKPSESILINGDIRIRVLSVHGSNIRLGIDAPKDVKIVRNEITTAGEKK